MGKASRIPSAIDRLREQQIRSTALFALNRVRIVPKTIQAPSGGAAAVGGGVGGIGNFLPLSGGVMTGNIAFDPKVIDAPNGRVNLDPGGEDPKDSSNVLVLGIGTSPFNIRFIDGAQRDGQFLLYQGTNQQLQNLQNAITFTLTNIVGDGTTNIITATMASTTGLSNGDFVDVSFTTNFNKQDAVVANLTATTFTYDLGVIGSATPETVGTAQTGNIYTNDGNTLVLDGTASLLGIPTVLLVFNSTIFAGGGWIPATLGGGGTDGLTEPIILTLNTITPQTLPTKSTVDWSKNPNVIALDRAVEFEFSNLPTTGKYEGVLVIIDIGSTVGFASPIWPSSVANPPTIPITANTRVSVMLYTIDAGTIVTHATSVGSGTSVADASQWSTFPALQDVNFATFDGTNIDRLRFTASSGVVVSANDPSILLDTTSNMIFNIADQKQWFWTNGSETIMQLDRNGVNNDTVLTVETDSTDASAVPRIDIFRDDPSPVNDDEFGRIRFIGTDLALGAQVYSQIAVEYENVTTGRIASSMTFVTSFDTGSTTQFLPFMALNAANSGNIDMLRSVNYNDNSIFKLNTLELQDTGAFGAILFNADGARDTFISNNVADEDRIDVTVNGSNGVVFGFSTIKSLPSLSLTSPSGAFLNVSSNFVAFDPLAAPADGIIVNAEGLVFFDTSTDPAILKIKKKDSVGSISTVSLEAGGSTVFADDVFRIQDSVTPTKQIAFEATNITAGQTRTITMLNEDITIVGRSSTQTIQNKSFEDSNTTFIDTIAPTKKMAFDISPVTAGQTRVLSIQNQNGTIALLEGAAQTWTGVNTYSGKVNINANMDIGDSASDTVIVNSKINSNLVPNGATHNLGEATINPWNNIYSDNTLFCSNLKVFDTDSDINVFNDLDMQAGDTIDFADTATTAGTSSQTLPAQPDGFIIIKVNGVSKRVPFYVP